MCRCFWGCFDARSWFYLLSNVEPESCDHVTTSSALPLDLLFSVWLVETLASRNWNHWELTSPCPSLSCSSGDPAAEEWSQWSVCSLTCGQGWQVRTRSCVSSPYGTLCSGALRETRMCNNTASCPGEPGITGSGMFSELSIGCLSALPEFSGTDWLALFSHSKSDEGSISLYLLTCYDFEWFLQKSVTDWGPLQSASLSAVHAEKCPRPLWPQGGIKRLRE